MCSMKSSNWVTFEDEGSPPPFPQKPLQLPGSRKNSVPRPNGLKLVLPPVGDSSGSYPPLESPAGLCSREGGACVPCNTPLNTPLSTPLSGPASTLSGPWDQNDFFRSFSSSSTASAPSPGPDVSSTPALPEPSEDPPHFPIFQGDIGHFSPFWEEAGTCLDSGSSSSDSESGSSLPRFFIRPKEGQEPQRDLLQNSYSYICHKLEGLRAEEDHGARRGEEDHGAVRGEEDQGAVRGEACRSGCKEEEEGCKGPSPFIPRGLFRSQRRDGWSLMLRIPEKKNRMSSRQWGPIYLRLLPGGVLQMYYEKGLEKPFKEFQLLPHCQLSSLKLESYGEPRKILTVKVEQVSYSEKKRYHPKLELSHEVETEQLLKFGTTEHTDMEDLLAAMEEELLRMLPPLQRRHHEEQELSLHISDHVWLQLDKDGVLVDRAACTHIHCLAFLNGAGDCFLALNDHGLLRCDASYGPEEAEDAWMEISEWNLHRCVSEQEFQRTRLLKFCPPGGCRVELLRYRTLTPSGAHMPFSIKASVTVQGAYVELQAFLNMTSSWPADGPPLCEDVQVRVPVPPEWVKVSRTVSLLRQKSLKARMNRNACLGSVSAADSQPVIQVTVGTVKYENVYSAIVWRIDRLPVKNMVDHPHSLSCRLELGSDQDVPRDWYPYASIEYQAAGALASQTRVRSLGTESDIQPHKHVTSRTHCHCQVEIEKKWIEMESQKTSGCRTQ